MLYNRQKLLLHLLDAFSGSVEPIAFQKILFLYVQKHDLDTYHFVPHHFGCYSFQTRRDRKVLFDKGYISSDKGDWSLTDLYWVRDEKVSRSVKLFQSTLHLESRELIKYVYIHYPQTAWRSELLDTLELNADQINLIADEAPAFQSPGVLTIGYEGKSIDQYLGLLLNQSVDILVDVRKNPISRKWGFSKSTLSNLCSELGIQYLHLPALGIESSVRKTAMINGSFHDLFANYFDVLPKFGADLETITELVRKRGHRVALTCFEAAHDDCHRHQITRYLSQHVKLHAVHI